MGANLAKGNPAQQLAAKVALSEMCEAVAKAVLEVSQLEGPISTLSDGVPRYAANEILKICSEQADTTVKELESAIRREKFRRLARAAGGPGGVDPLRKLHADLLALELLRVALSDDDSMGGTSRPGTSSGTGPSGARAIEGGSSPGVTMPITKKDIIGKGSFGTVYKAADKKGMTFVLKEVTRSDVNQSILEREMRMIMRFSHRNLVNVFGFGLGRENIFIYIEEMQESVKDRMNGSGKPLSLQLAKRYTSDLLKGLEFLHSKDIVHRNIKCANLMLDKFAAKLSDMGIPKASGETKYVKGNIFWTSPEVVGGQDFSKKADIWSVGCTAYEMVKAKPPFADDVTPVLAQLILPKMIMNMEHRDQIQKEGSLGRDLQNFLLRIFVKVGERPFSGQISGHPWVK